jgi:predicted XRE-type DNA-binding protein
MSATPKKTDTGIEYVECSSGNIFADLGLANPEEMLLKANLAIAIRRLIEAKELTQAEAGKLVGLSQPKISDILHGRLRGYSVERLLGVVNRLGHNVEVRIAEEDVPANEARTMVTVS